MKSLSRVRLFATPWTVAYQASPSMGLSRQEYWSGLPFPFPGDHLCTIFLYKPFYFYKANDNVLSYYFLVISIFSLSLSLSFFFFLVKLVKNLTMLLIFLRNQFFLYIFHLLYYFYILYFIYFTSNLYYCFLSA